MKDEPSEIVGGMSSREAYIHKSEKQVKPTLGERFYGRMFTRKLWAHVQQHGMPDMVAITDSGFMSECVDPLEAIGAETCLLIRVHAVGRGKSFKKDSRGFITLRGVEITELENDVLGDTSAYEEAIVEAVAALRPARAVRPAAALTERELVRKRTVFPF